MGLGLAIIYSLVHGMMFGRRRARRTALSRGLNRIVADEINVTA
jgi:hypothetical protein